MKSNQWIVASVLLIGIFVGAWPGALIDAAESPVTLTGLSGLATASGFSALFHNPASAVEVSRTETHVGSAVSAVSLQTAGPAQILAYAEPDQGYGAGVLGYVRTFRTTGYDAVLDKTLYDRSNEWVYAVARPFGQGSAGGVRLVYQGVAKETTGQYFHGYRIDIGLTQTLGAGFHAGLLVKGILNTQKANWSNQTIGVGIGYQGGQLRAVLDVWRSGAFEPLTVTTGVQWDFDAWDISVGVTRSEDVMFWSGGLTYQIGSWDLGYAYYQQGSVHKIGASFHL